MASVTLPYPPSANHLRIAHNGRLITSPEYRAWQETAVFLVRQAMQPIERYPITVSILLSTRNMRRDADNAVKPTMDALVKAGVLEDDNLAHVTTITVRLMGIMPREEESVTVHVVQP